jgi:hypothetical protein
VRFVDDAKRPALYRTVERADERTVAAAARLGNAVLLTHDGYGHTSDADPSTCVDRAMTTYLVDLVVPPKGTVCLSNLLPFDPHYQ